MVDLSSKPKTVDINGHEIGVFCIAHLALYSGEVFGCLLFAHMAVDELRRPNCVVILWKEGAGCMDSGCIVAVVLNRDLVACRCFVICSLFDY